MEGFTLTISLVCVLMTFGRGYIMPQFHSPKAYNSSIPDKGSSKMPYTTRDALSRPIVYSTIENTGRYTKYELPLGQQHNNVGSLTRAKKQVIRTPSIKQHMFDNTKYTSEEHKNVKKYIVIKKSNGSNRIMQILTPPQNKYFSTERKGGKPFENKKKSFPQSSMIKSKYFQNQNLPKQLGPRTHALGGHVNSIRIIKPKFIPLPVSSKQYRNSRHTGVLMKESNKRYYAVGPLGSRRSYDFNTFFKSETKIAEEAPVVSIRTLTPQSRVDVTHLYPSPGKLKHLLRNTDITRLWKPFNLINNACATGSKRFHHPYLCFYAINKCSEQQCYLNGKICDIVAPCMYPLCEIKCVNPKSNSYQRRKLACPREDFALNVFHCINDRACYSGGICCHGAKGSRCVYK